MSQMHESNVTLVNENIFTILEIVTTVHPQVRILEYLDICHCTRPSKLIRGKLSFVVDSGLNVSLYT